MCYKSGTLKSYHANLKNILIVFSTAAQHIVQKNTLWTRLHLVYVLDISLASQLRLCSRAPYCNLHEPSKKTDSLLDPCLYVTTVSRCVSVKDDHRYSNIACPRLIKDNT